MKRIVIAVTCLLSILGAFVPGASALTPSEKCEVAKLQAVAKRVTGAVNCRVKALKKGEPVDPACLAKVETTYQKAMARAEKSVTCSGDAGQLEALADQFVDAVLGQTIAKTVFITSTSHTGNLGGLAGADAICQARADAAGLSGTYKAWLSDATTAARDRLTHAVVPYVLVDGTRIAGDWDDLVDGLLDNPIQLTETGETAGLVRAWTATQASGDRDLAFFTCANWMSDDNASVFGSRGQATGKDSSWSLWLSGDIPCSSEAQRLYCFQQ